MLSLAVGIGLLAIGGVCVIAGVVVAVVETLRPAGQRALPVEETVRALEVLRDVVKAFAGLAPAGQLLLVGLVLIAGGVVLIYARPF